MDIEPISVDQLVRDSRGRMTLVEADVGNVVADIQRINPEFRVRVSEHGNFIVYQVRGHKENLVLTSATLDQRIVQRIREITHPSYDLVADLEVRERAADKKQEEMLDEQIGIHGERIAHALRKDLGVESDVARSRKAWGRGNNG
jgi:Zn-finger domain-containing protein